VAAGPVLVDSTVLIRLILGEEGADFAVNLLSRAEQGLETIVLPSTAFLAAVSSALVAAASAESGAETFEESVAKLYDVEVREKAYTRVQPLVDYIDRLVKMGRIIPYNVTVDDISEAYRRASRQGLTLLDAITVVVAEKLKIQKVATFSKRLRVGLQGFTVLPPSEQTKRQKG